MYWGEYINEWLTWTKSIWNLLYNVKLAMKLETIG